VKGPAVGVVAFDPKRELIIPLLSASLAEAECAFVFVNAIIDDAVLQALYELGPACRIIRCAENLGVAEALNIIALHAILAGYGRVLMFDQDSRPPKGLVAGLSRAMDLLAASGEQVAVVGPGIVAPRTQEREFKSPRYFRARERLPAHGIMPVRYVITSGSLVDLAAFRAIGKFRSDFFMDSVDTEWCFRAWSRGFSCWYVPALSMEHTIGEGMLLGRYPRQSAMRMYTWFRNQVVTIGLPHVPLLWKVRLAAYAAMLAGAVILDARFDRRIVRSIGGALVDGWRGKLGPAPGAQKTRQLPLE
jgi:rhamnosyltransferase